MLSFVIFTWSFVPCFVPKAYISLYSLHSLSCHFLSFYFSPVYNPFTPTAITLVAFTKSSTSFFFYNLNQRRNVLRNFSSYLYRHKFQHTVAQTDRQAGGYSERHIGYYIVFSLSNLLMSYML